MVVCAAMGRAGPAGAAEPEAAAGSRCTATRSPRRCASADEHGDVGPRSTLIDERYKVAISRLGKRVRVAGSAELGGTLQPHNDGALATLYKVLDDWFPGVRRAGPGAELERRAADAARRPAGDRRQRLDRRVAQPRPRLQRLGTGLRLARVLADAMAGRPPAIDLEGLGIERLR